MFCTQCGFETPEDGGFCPNCGARQQPVVQQQSPAQPVYQPAPQPVYHAPRPAGPSPIVAFFKRIPKKTLIIAGSALVVVIVVIILLTTLLGGGGGSYGKDSANAVYAFRDADAGELLFVGRSSVLDDSISTDSNFYLHASADQSIIAVNSDGDLQIVTLKSFEEIDQDAQGIMAMASSGRALVYCALNDDDDIDLIRYDIGSKRSTVIDTFTTDDNLVSLCISPDGQSVGYAIESDGDIVASLSVNGRESEEFGDDQFPMYLTDGAALVYYLEGNEDETSGTLNVMKNGDSTELSSNYNGNRIFFNQSGNEILYTENGKTYFSKDGNEGEKVLKYPIEYFLWTEGQVNAASTAGYSVLIMETRTMLGMVAQTDEDYYYFGSQGEFESIDVESYYVQISANGQSLLFVDDKGDIQIIRNLAQSLEPVALAEDVDANSVLANDDFSAVYFVDEDNELFYMNGSEPKSIADDVSSYNMAFGNNNTLYFIDSLSSSESGQLYSTRSGGDKVKIKDASEATSIASFAGGITYYNVDDEITYFITSSGQTIEIGDGNIYRSY